MLNRINDKKEEIIGDHQTGFMKERSIIDQIFILKARPQNTGSTANIFTLCL